MNGRSARGMIVVLVAVLLIALMNVMFSLRSFALAPLLMFWIPVIMAILFALLGSARGVQRRQPSRRQPQQEGWKTVQARQRGTVSGRTQTTQSGLTPKQIAGRAVRRAGNDPDNWKLVLDDVGILSYHGDNTPDICRARPVPNDASHIRPYLVIDLPYKQGKGTISLSLYDETGDKRFESKQTYTLIQGQNLITTRTWLPLPESRTGGRWTLRAAIGDLPFAVHEFEVHPAYGGQIKEFMGTDGEIDPWLAKAVNEQSLSETLSLDDLLADQYDDAESASSAASLR